MSKILRECIDSFHSFISPNKSFCSLVNNLSVKLTIRSLVLKKRKSSPVVRLTAYWGKSSYNGTFIHCDYPTFHESIKSKVNRDGRGAFAKESMTTVSTFPPGTMAYFYAHLLVHTNAQEYEHTHTHTHTHTQTHTHTHTHTHKLTHIHTHTHTKKIRSPTMKYNGRYLCAIRHCPIENHKTSRPIQYILENKIRESVISKLV